MSDFFNMAGLVLNVIGSFLLAKYGLPNLKILSSGAYSEIEQTAEITKSQRHASLGLWLLFLGFAVQLMAFLIAKPCLSV